MKTINGKFCLLIFAAAFIFLFTDLTPTLAEQDNNYQDWMHTYQEELQNYTINQVTLLGAHDALSYGIQEGSLPVTGYKKDKIHDPANLDDVQSARCQADEIIDQLNSGVRYFDFRIASQQEVPADSQPYAYWGAHEWLSVPLKDVCVQIKDFLEKNPDEIIILNVKSLYGNDRSMTGKEQEKFYINLQNDLGDQIIPQGNFSFAGTTLGELWQTTGRIIVLGDRRYSDYVWDDNGENVDNQWMKEKNPNKLCQDLTQKVESWKQGESQDKLKILQAMTTTDEKIADAKKTNELVHQHILRWNEIYKINIIQVDDVTNSDLMPQILECNNIH